MDQGPVIDRVRPMDRCVEICIQFFFISNKITKKLFIYMCNVLEWNIKWFKKKKLLSLWLDNDRGGHAASSLNSICKLKQSPPDILELHKILWANSNKDGCCNKIQNWSEHQQQHALIHHHYSHYWQWRLIGVPTMLSVSENSVLSFKRNR